MIAYSDEQIIALLAETKELPIDYKSRLIPKATKRGQMERDLALTGANGTPFLIIVRQAIANPLRFSAILACPKPAVSNLFLLRRYNGDHGPHTNHLEGEVIRGTHVHMATERYQAAGWNEEAFAVSDGRFVDVHSAIECLILDNGFVTPAIPIDQQLSLFESH